MGSCISLIKKNKNRQYLVKFYRGECLGSPHTGYGGGIWLKIYRFPVINY